MTRGGATTRGGGDGIDSITPRFGNKFTTNVNRKNNNTRAAVVVVSCAGVLCIIVEVSTVVECLRGRKLDFGTVFWYEQKIRPEIKKKNFP